MSDDMPEGSPAMSAQDEAAQRAAAAESEKVINKLKILGMQMQGMNKEEKSQHSGQIDGIAKALSKLRRAIRNKMPDNSWKWTLYIAIVVSIVVYAFFGYKLYRSLTEKHRKREEKLKAKQSRKKK